MLLHCIVLAEQVYTPVRVILRANAHIGVIRVDEEIREELSAPTVHLPLHHADPCLALSIGQMTTALFNVGTRDIARCRSWREGLHRGAAQLEPVEILLEHPLYLLISLCLLHGASNVRRLKTYLV